MASVRQQLPKPKYEPLPTIKFYCACGKWLYRLSTNVTEWENAFTCPKCGRRYECKDSIIAKLVSDSASSLRRSPTAVPQKRGSGATHRTGRK